jgi:2-haloacid dehalogenase
MSAQSSGQPPLPRATVTGRITVTFDLFSALIDSRTGGSRALQSIADRRGWAVSGEALYAEWDRHNKSAQKGCVPWRPWRVPATAALRRTYEALGLAPANDAEADTDIATLSDSMSAWPLWPDVAEGLPRLARTVRVGLLSNVDDALFARTAAAPLIDPEVALTSEGLGAYKPHPEIYLRAKGRLGDVVHVPTSARDVRGALEAGIPVVRLRRPGHELEPGGPQPEHEVGSIDEVGALLAG